VGPPYKRVRLKAHGEKETALASRPSRDNEDELRRLYESTPAMLYSIDRSGCITAVSDLWLAKMGYTREEVLGRTSLEFLTPESAQHARSVVQPAFFVSGRCFDVAFQSVKKNGEKVISRSDWRRPSVPHRSAASPCRRTNLDSRRRFRGIRRRQFDPPGGGAARGDRARGGTQCVA
jgi:PAS domain S-box-containing protein